VCDITLDILKPAQTNVHLPLTQALTAKKSNKEKPIQQKESEPYPGQAVNHEDNHKKEPVTENQQKEPIPFRIQEPLSTPTQDYRPP
jgi:hypothetical protein